MIPNPIEREVGLASVSPWRVGPRRYEAEAKAAQLGVLASFNRVSIAASAITIAGKQWQGSIGIGIKIGKQKK